MCWEFEGGKSYRGGTSGEVMEEETLSSGEQGHESGVQGEQRH